MIKINCIWNDQGAWCKSKSTKRSLFGIGARCCIEFDSNKKCSWKVPFPIPKVSPPAPIPTALITKKLLKKCKEENKKLKEEIQNLKEKLCYSH